tara:strand:- start:88 stop:510 length:423 start_codon:yes stop_codon:yes gene_type:complete
MSNPPDNILKKFEEYKQSQETKRKEKYKRRANTWKFKYIKHEFKHDFAEPIPKEDGDIFYIMTQVEADKLNRECARTKSPYTYRKYKTHIEGQKKILKSIYGKDYPLLTEGLKRDARIESEKQINKLMEQVKKLKTKNKG